MMDKYRLLLIHPGRLMRGALKMVLQQSGSEVHDVASAQELIRSENLPAPDVVIWSGETVTKRLISDVAAVRSRFSRARTPARHLVLTGELTPAFTRQIAPLNVEAVLHDDISAEVLLKTIELVLLGQRLIPMTPQRGAALPLAEVVPFPSASQRAAREPFAQANAVTFSHREGTILKELIQGASNKAIALKLQITEATVKVHVRALLRKIRASNRTQAATWALNNRYEVADKIDTSRLLIENRLKRSS